MKVLPTMGSMYSGSLRGITASHNKGGLYFRGRTIPTNPNTARQQSIRSVMNGIVQRWSDNLSESQREAWRSYAANVPVTDSLGQTMQLSGVNWFVKSQSVPEQVASSGLQNVSGIVTNDAPVVFNTGESVQDVTLLAADFTGPAALQVQGTFGGAVPANGSVILFIAPPQTPGTRYYKGPYQLAAGQNFLADATTWNITVDDLADPLDWVSDITPVAGWDGLFIPIKVVVQYEDGRRAEMWRGLVEFEDITP